MEASEDGFKSEAHMSQISIRCAKAATMLSSLNRHLDSSINHQQHKSEENDVVKLKREMENLKMELVRGKVTSKNLKCLSLMELIILQISLLVSLSALCFVFFNY